MNKLEKVRMLGAKIETYIERGDLNTAHELFLKMLGDVSEGTKYERIVSEALDTFLDKRRENREKGMD